MGVVLPRSLAILSGLLLALPQGWCCFFGVADCCAKPQQTQKEESAPPTPKRSCCCCLEQPSGEPTDSEPVPPPTKPAKSCCCEKQPTAPPKAVQQLPDLDALPSTLPIPLTTDAREESVPAGQVFIGPSPPLHVLHCIWLC
jgi:hypothetical protein